MQYVFEYYYQIYVIVSRINLNFTVYPFETLLFYGNGYSQPNKIYFLFECNRTNAEQRSVNINGFSTKNITFDGVAFDKSHKRRSRLTSLYKYMICC